MCSRRQHHSRHYKVWRIGRDGTRLCVECSTWCRHTLVHASVFLCRNCQPLPYTRQVVGRDVRTAGAPRFSLMWMMTSSPSHMMLFVANHFSLLSPRTATDDVKTINDNAVETCTTSACAETVLQPASNWPVSADEDNELSDSETSTSSNYDVTVRHDAASEHTDDVKESSPRKACSHYRATKA